MSNDERRPTIFLSYAHADKTRAQRLAAALEEAGYTVWWDALIEGGSRFASSIDEALDAADAIIVLWSKNSIESDWVRDEATQARDRNRLVPVSLDNCRPPMGFRQYQMIDIEIAPGLAEGHLALAYARFAGFLDIGGAQPSYEKAYELGRGNADVVLLYALYAVRARRYAAARDAIERALALDPLNPRTHRAAGTVAYASRRYADAVTEYRRALQLNPKISIARAFMGDALLQMGKLDEAREAYAAETAPMFRLRGLAIVEHRAGNRAAAEKAFNALVSEIGDAAMYQQAEVMAQWGRTDDALARLQRAREIGDSGLSYVATDPLLDPIAKDPRFLRFIRDLGFT